MNSYPPPPRRWSSPPTDPMSYVTRRLSSLLAVAGAIIGVAVVSLLDGVGLPILVPVAIGLVLFLAAAAWATSLPGDIRLAAVAAGENSKVDSSYAAGHSLREWGQASQLGPDAEQVIGRQTGARI